MFGRGLFTYSCSFLVTEKMWTISFPELGQLAKGFIRFDRKYSCSRASLVALVVKNTPSNAGDLRDVGSIPRLERSLGEGNGNAHQYSCLENPMDRGAWWATVPGVKKSWTPLKWMSTHTHACSSPLYLHRA